MIKKEMTQKEQAEKRNKSEEKNEMRKESIKIFASVEEVLTVNSKDHSNTIISRHGNNLHSSLGCFPNRLPHHGHSSSYSPEFTHENRNSNLSSNSKDSNLNMNLNNLIITNHFGNSATIDREYITNNFELIKGETLIDYEEAFYKNEEINLIGTIVLTDYRVIFKFNDSSLQEKLNLDENYFRIPLFHITKIEKSHEKKNMTKYNLDFNTKDHRSMRFVVMSEQLKFYANVNIITFPKDSNLYFTFAFKYREALSNCNRSNSLTEDWRIFDPIKEFQRQGVNFFDDDYQLKISNLNKNFALCPTYPEFLILPKSLSDEEVKEASLFRTKNRLPTLSYIYSTNIPGNKTGSKGSYASIWRSSQTKSGLGQSRSNADEKLLKAISTLNEKLVIYDARPYINALANRVKGGGFENVSNYYKTELFFCEIENIHSVRNSLNKVWTLCNSSKIMNNKKFRSNLEDTDWYEYIHLIIKSSIEVASSIKKNLSVLVHCSDGWDRSTQLVSLAQMLLDPYYRTIEGLIVLIEKDWLSFGHQFALRNGIYSKEISEDQRAPIFLQWLDCIHQLVTQFPNAFEFNMELLLFLASHYNSNLYGTFLYNCEQERVEKEAKYKTVSIWTDILQNKKKYRNPYYELQPYVLSPNYAPFKMRLWEEFFLKSNYHIESNKICIDYSKGVSVKHTEEFFNFQKLNDKRSLNSLQKKVDRMEEIIDDIYMKTKDNEELFDTFEDTTKLCLTLNSQREDNKDTENKDS